MSVRAIAAEAGLDDAPVARVGCEDVAVGRQDQAERLLEVSARGERDALVGQRSAAGHRVTERSAITRAAGRASLISLMSASIAILLAVTVAIFKTSEVNPGSAM